MPTHLGQAHTFRSRTHPQRSITTHPGHLYIHLFYYQTQLGQVYICPGQLPTYLGQLCPHLCQLLTHLGQSHLHSGRLLTHTGVWVNHSSFQIGYSYIQVNYLEWDVTQAVEHPPVKVWII